MKSKYNDNVKLCYMDTDSFIMNITANDFYEDIANDVENSSDTSKYEVNRPLPTRKNKKSIGLMKDNLQSVTKIMGKTAIRIISCFYSLPHFNNVENEWAKLCQPMLWVRNIV